MFGQPAVSLPRAVLLKTHVAQQTSAFLAIYIPMSPSSQRQVVFHFHLFKNAGTSIDANLRRIFGDNFLEVELGGPADLFPAQDLFEILESRWLTRDRINVNSILSDDEALFETASKVVEDFPFIGVVERFRESLYLLNTILKQRSIPATFRVETENRSSNAEKSLSERLRMIKEMIGDELFLELQQANSLDMVDRYSVRLFTRTFGQSWLFRLTCKLSTRQVFSVFPVLLVTDLSRQTYTTTREAIQVEQYVTTGFSGRGEWPQLRHKLNGLAAGTRP